MGHDADSTASLETGSVKTELRTALPTGELRRRVKRPESFAHHSMEQATEAEPAARHWPLLRAMRPHQWTKNAIVFAALVFDQRLLEWTPLWRSVVAALVFCAVSSGIYLINDLRDVEADRIHPKKRHRAIASGQLAPRAAWVAAAILLSVGLGVALWLRAEFAAVVLGYVVLMIAYSAGLKSLVILDVFAIAAGFVIRAAGGGLAIDVPISPWLFVCTALLALFIGFGKRRNELTTLAHSAGQHRANLDAYSIPLLDQMIGVVASSTVMAYALYTFDAVEADSNEGGRVMMLTIPFVGYAIFRYLYLVHRKELGGSPETLLFTDRPLLLGIVGWGLTSLVILYLS